MNSHKNNEKIIQILSEMEPIHDETDEEKANREKMAQEAIKNAEEEAPLAFPKKVAGVICVSLWGFSIMALMFGFGDLGVMMPFMLLSLGAVCGLNIPAFWKKGKIFDVVAAIVACAFCALMAFGLLFVGGNR